MISHASADSFSASFRPDLYLKNLFRRTGISVLAHRREVSRRLEQLGMAAELGTAANDWVLAPVEPLEQTDVRELAQQFNDPQTRLLHEFFWFWPARFPETTPDPIIDCLARGDSKSALDSWHEREFASEMAAVHNLALYYHFLALDLERAHSPSEALLSRYWTKTFGYWQSVIEDERIWSALDQRVRQLNDPQIPSDWVARFRSALPESLARINAAIAAKHAERNRLALAAQNAAFVRTVLNESAVARQLLQSEARGFIARFEQHLDEFREAAARGVLDLAKTESMLETGRADLAVLQSLCGANDETCVESASKLADLALDQLVAYQRETLDSQSSLRLLDQLQSLPLHVALRNRLLDTRQALVANLKHDEGATIAFSSPEYFATALSDPATAHAQFLQEVVPALTRRGGGTLADEDRTRCSEFLSRLAAELSRQQRDPETISAILRTALNLAGSAEEESQLQDRLTTAESLVAQAKEKSSKLSVGEHTFTLDGTGVRWDDQLIPWKEITGIRHSDPAAPATGRQQDRYVIACEAGGREWVWNKDNLFGFVPDPAETHRRLLDSFDFFLVPSLVSRLASRVQSGKSVSVGAFQLETGGVVLASRGLLRRKTVLIPYSRLHCALDQGQVTVSSLDQPNVSEKQAAGDSWNCALLPRLIEKLAIEGNPSQPPDA